jgi:hypothetical protein
MPEKSSSNPEFVAFSSHVSSQLEVAPAAIANGFYKGLYGLQGQRNISYTSAPFQSRKFSVIWRFMEGLLPIITA